MGQLVRYSIPGGKSPAVTTQSVIPPSSVVPLDTLDSVVPPDTSDAADEPLVGIPLLRDVWHGFPSHQIAVSSYYPVFEPPVATNRAEALRALDDCGLVLFHCGSFVYSEMQQSGSSPADVRASIRSSQNTYWKPIINGAELVHKRMNSSASLTNWHARGGTWLSKALRRLDLLRTSDGDRTVEPYGLLRLVGLRRQYWHGDAAFPGRLDPIPIGDIPLSAMHPLSMGGTTLLAVLRNSGHPVQIFIPPQFLAIWRGDLEHAGDEFLHAENLTLFASPR